MIAATSRLAATVLWAAGSAGVVQSRDSAARSADVPAVSPVALDATARRVASELRCPVCQGLSIQDSPSELALEMKAVVREQLAAGRTPDEVKEYFIGKYGEWVLLEPKPSGLNLLVYVLPLLGVAGGGALIWLAVRRWTSAPSPPSGS